MKRPEWLTRALAAQGEAAETPRNKYGVRPKGERTWRGKVYPSKAEMLYAQVLDYLLQGRQIAAYREQVRLTLGPSGIVYVADFLVTNLDGTHYYVDVKGYQTPEFKLKKRLWLAHGLGELVLIKRARGRFVVVEKIAGPGFVQP